MARHTRLCSRSSFETSTISSIEQHGPTEFDFHQTSNQNIIETDFRAGFENCEKSSKNSRDRERGYVHDLESGQCCRGLAGIGMLDSIALQCVQVLCSGAWRSTVGLHHLGPQLFQFHHCRCSHRQPHPSSLSGSDCASNSAAPSKSENFRMLSRNFLHFCQQRDNRPGFTNVTITLYQCSSNRSSVKMLGSEICRVRKLQGLS